MFTSSLFRGYNKVAISGYVAAMASASLLYEYKFESFLPGMPCKRVNLYCHKQKVNSWCDKLAGLKAPNNIQSRDYSKDGGMEDLSRKSSWRT